MALTRVIVRLATTQRQTETRRTLDGVDYRLRFRYVRETGRWTLTVMDANGVALVSGIRVVLGIDHPHYGHMALLGPDSRAALARDFA